MSKKKVSFGLLCFALFASLAWSQSSPPISTLELTLPLNSTDTPASQANLVLIGNPGPSAACYWLVSHFLLGEGSPVSIGCINTLPNALSGSNYVRVTPFYPAGVLTVDLLKTPGMTTPSGACNCAVATAVSAGSINDQSNATSSYTLNAYNPANFSVTLDNEVQGAGSTHLILRQNGAFVSDLSISGGFTVGGDLFSNSSSSQEVVGLKNNPLPALSVGFLNWTGTAWALSAGNMTWPAAPGITVCTGTPCTAWGTSLTAPTGSIVGTIDTQTLTNKTVDGVTPAVFGYVDPTSSIQTQLNSKAALAGATFTGEIVTKASASGGAGFNLPPGAAPTSPVNGDCWTTSAGMFCQINGATVGPFGTGSGGMVYPSGTGIPQVVSGTSWGTTITPATGIANFLATPSSANLATALTDEIGSGKSVFATALQGTDVNLMTSGTISGSAGTNVCLDSNSGLTTSGCTSGGGPGTGTQYDLSYWTTTTTLGSVGGSTTVTGQVPTFQNGSAPVATSPGFSDAASSPVSSSAYTIQCDSSTAIIDRGHGIRFQSGASAPVIPLSSASGCANLMVSVMGDGAGALTFGRTGSDTFTIFDGVTKTDGATSFSLNDGQYASVNQAAAGIWEVRLNSGNASKLNGTALSGLGTGILKITTGVPTIAASSDVILLWTGSCSSSTFLRGDGACAAGGGGDTITSPNSTLTVGGTSSATTLDLAGAAGKIMAGATPALTYTPTLGVSGSAGTLAMFPTSGNVTTTLGSAATASNTFLFPAAVFGNNHLGYCVVSSTTCTWTDAGYAFNAIPTADLAATGTFVFNNAVNTGTSAMTLDLSAATGATAFKVPVIAGATAGADGVVDYDSTGKITHVRTNGADSDVAATTSTSTTTTQVLHATAVAGIYTPSAIATADLPAQYSKGSCTEVWGGSGTSFAMTSGDDAISNNSCYNDSGVTRTITAVKCRSDNAANTTVLTPTFGSAGTGTAILTGTLTCGNSYAYSATGTLNNTSWTTGTGIDPGMSTVGNATSIAMIVEYTY